MDEIHADASEGDVEVQIVIPLLTLNNFLGIPLENVRSKKNLAARDIGKGAKRKTAYIPDFCVFIKSLPILVVEAKSPTASARDAYDESRLYATEINSSFLIKSIRAAA